MKRLAGVAILFLALLPKEAGAQTKPCPREVVLTVVSVTTGYLTCERGSLVIEGAGSLYDVSAQADDPTSAPVRVGRATVVRLPVGLSAFGEITFDPPLAKGKAYVFSMQPSDITGVLQRGAPGSPWIPVPAPGGWAALYVPFSTKPVAALVPIVDETDHAFRIVSTVGIQPCTPGPGGKPHEPMLVEEIAQRSDTLHAADLRRESLLGASEVDASTSSCEIPPPDAFLPNRVGTGTIKMRIGAFRQGSVKLNVKGVYNVFGDELTVPAAKQKLTVGAVPKDKEDATYFGKFAHEASEGVSPGWTIDAKLAPVFNRDLGGGFQPTLNLSADVGFGKTKSPNTLSLGGGLTRLIPTGARQLQAIRFSPVLTVEADRHFTEKLNLLLEPDFRFYMPWMNLSRAVLSRRKYVDALTGATPEQAEELDPDDRKFYQLTGFSATAWVGAEVGHVLRESTVETDDKSSSVTVPTHAIARLRGKFQATFEIDRVSIGLSLTPRYVVATEMVGRIVDVEDAAPGEASKRAELLRIDGAQNYGEFTVQIGLDRSGHIALATTYKRGPTPPTFESVNVVQTGLTIKY